MHLAFTLSEAGISGLPPPPGQLSVCLLQGSEAGKERRRRSSLYNAYASPICAGGGLHLSIRGHVDAYEVSSPGGSVMARIPTSLDCFSSLVTPHNIPQGGCLKRALHLPQEISAHAALSVRTFVDFWMARPAAEVATSTAAQVRAQLTRRICTGGGQAHRAPFSPPPAARNILVFSPASTYRIECTTKAPLLLCWSALTVTGQTRTFPVDLFSC